MLKKVTRYHCYIEAEDYVEVAPGSDAVFVSTQDSRYPTSKLAGIALDDSEVRNLVKRLNQWLKRKH